MTGKTLRLVMDAVSGVYSDDGRGEVPDAKETCRERGNCVGR